MPPQFRSIRRVLVANRGEIAVRVMRTCRERGIETVAVYSDVDRRAPHVQLADYAIGIGPAPAAQSYLVIEKILAACRESGADAVHPDYGFLSENEDFAEACRAAGITFIGPSPDAMRKMGSKTEARKTVSAAGTPVVPGDNGPTGDGFPSAAQAVAAARKIGFPVLIKAAAGGGGKGMRLLAAETGVAAPSGEATTGTHPPCPGAHRDLHSFPTRRSSDLAARKIGFPVLIKAAAGGGGKGMRLVAAEPEFAA